MKNNISWQVVTIIKRTEEFQDVEETLGGGREREKWRLLKGVHQWLQILTLSHDNVLLKWLPLYVYLGKIIRTNRTLIDYTIKSKKFTFLNIYTEDNKLYTTRTKNEELSLSLSPNLSIRPSLYPHCS